MYKLFRLLLLVLHVLIVAIFSYRCRSGRLEVVTMEDTICFGSRE